MRLSVAAAPRQPKPSSLPQEGSIELDCGESDEELVEAPGDRLAGFRAPEGTGAGYRVGDTEVGAGIGPALGPAQRAGGPAGRSPQQGASTAAAAAAAGAAAPAPRMAGPARPPQELLAAAMEAALAVRATPPLLFVSPQSTG